MVAESARSRPEPVGGGRGGGGRQAVGPVDVHPHALALADIGDGAERIHRAGQRGAGGGHDGDGREAPGTVARERVGERVGAHPPPLVGRQPSQRPAAQAGCLDCADDGVVSLVGAVDRPAAAGDAVLAGAGQRLLARR